MPSLTLPRQFPFDDPQVPYRIDVMRLSDLSQVMPIEQAAFPAPWPVSAYRYELTQNDLSTYLVLLERRPHSSPGWRAAARRWVRGPLRSVLAYGGLWTILDEAHISTLAVHPEWRGQGLGEMMLSGLLGAAILRGAALVTLEVRVSNATAQNLYHKYAFAQTGRRRRYYHDNNEDALIMTTPRLDDSDFEARFGQLKGALRERLARWPAVEA
jgi:ribosomal-protein-alanine N-acetyltransferase